MIAEIYGKISSRGTNLTDTIEDNLTGNVFGSLRYIPFSKGIKKILIDKIEPQYFDENEVEQWAELIEFWPYHKDGELDAIIRLKSTIIGIEVKYNSGLSSDDEIDNDSDENSCNQLARESRILREIAERECKNPILLFIARDSSGKFIIKDVVKRNIIDNNVILKFISWEDIYEIIESSKNDENLLYHEKIILRDIEKLLYRKGFNSFKNFNINEENLFINKDQYYKFMYQEDDDISFEVSTKIEEEKYYEFK